MATAPGVPAWSRKGEAWLLTVPGSPVAGLPGDWPAPPEALHAGSLVQVAGLPLQALDPGLTARLWALAEQLRLRGAQLDLHGLPAGQQALLALAQPAPEAPTAGALPGRPADPAPALRKPSSLAVTVGFFGEVLLALGRWLRGRSNLRLSDVLHQLDDTGPRTLGIVVLACALIGLMLAYMGGAQLGRIGAQNFLADVVTVGMVRELGGMMTGIILAGRVGSAFAAQLATMQANEEIDALRVLGVDPVDHLVLPRLLALLLVGPVLIAAGAVAGVLAGWPAAVLAYGVTSGEYLHQCLRALTFTHLWIGLFKGMLYVALVALAGCRDGLHAGRSAQAVGEATTAAVVRALLWIVATACATTVVFTNLGY